MTFVVEPPNLVQTYTMISQAKNIIREKLYAILVVGHLELKSAKREFAIFLRFLQNLSPPRAFIETSSPRGKMI